MLGYMLKFIKKYYDYFIFMVLRIFVIMTIFPLGVSSLMKIKVTVQGDISKYGRGTYDLLVRNPDSLTKVEKDLKLIDESYAENAKGGISMKQYKDIKKIRGIEVAAPIANLGHYDNGNSVMTIFTRANQRAKMDVTFKTYDGPNVYDIEKYTIYQTSSPKEFITDEYKLNYEFDKNNNIYKYAPYVIGSGAIGSIGSIDFDRKGMIPIKGVTFKVLTTYLTLYAVDPEQQAICKKVAVSLLPRKVQEVKNVKDASTDKVYDKAKEIEVVTNIESPIRIKAEIKINKINVSQEQVRSAIQKNDLGEKLVVDLQSDNIKNNINLMEHQQEFMVETVLLNLKMLKVRKLTGI